MCKGGPHTAYLTGHDYMLSGDRPSNKEQRDRVKRDIYDPSSWEKQIHEYYYQTTHQLIKTHSDELQENQYQLDVVKE